MRLLLLRFLLLFVLAGASAGPALAQLDGTYDVVGPVPARHSLDVVQMEEFLNFTCPHCNNFRQASKPLLKKYGARLRATNVPILFSGQPDYPLRLYFVAERAGRGDELKTLIFDATFRYGVNIYDPKVVNYLARTAGLTEAFAKHGNAEWVNRKIAAAHARADQVGVKATPTIVLNGSLRMTPQTGMQTFVDNLDRLIAQLLRKSS